MFKRPAIAALLLLLPACTSHIVPLQPVQRVEEWVPDEPATTIAATLPATTTPADATSTAPSTSVAMTTTAAGTLPEATTATAATTATTTAATTQATATTTTAPATQPGHMVVKVIDPNQTARFIYKASYDTIWRQAIALINATGFAVDRQDYRLGVITSYPLPSSQIVEFWKPQHADLTDSLENTVNNQRRILRLTISNVEGKPDFYQIGIQVIVERETNPSETVGGPIFVEGSGFGRNSVTLRSDYAAPNVEPARWVTMGHDPDLERKLIDALFGRI